MVARGTREEWGLPTKEESNPVRDGLQEVEMEEHRGFPACFLTPLVVVVFIPSVIESWASGVQHAKHKPIQ